MDITSLKASTREAAGTIRAKQMRRTGRIPAVLYGGGQESVSLSIDDKEFRQVIHGKQGLHAIVELDVEGDKKLNGPAIIKGVQPHPVRNEFLHADFMRIDLKKKIKTMVATKLEGQAIGVIEDGVVDHQSREIEVECLALDVPDAFIVNITELNIGDSIHVSELTVPDNVTILTPADRTVVAVHAPRVVVEEEPEEGEEGLEGEEVAEGEAAEGEGEDGDKSTEKTKD